MKLGTRGSALALAQAQPVADALGADIVVIQTSGDRGIGAPTDKQRWVDAIEDALLADEIDLAVHSAKDLPGELAEGLEIVAAAGRVDPSDALIGADRLDDLPSGAKVAASSPRRRAQLLAARPDLEVVAISGNVDTRMEKLHRGEAEAMVLASAGLDRLGRGAEIGKRLDPRVFIPAPGQGTLAIEARAGFDASAVADASALTALLMEREVASRLGATCNSAVGVFAEGELLHTWVGADDGSRWIADSDGGTPEQIISRLMSVGAQDLLA